MSELSPPPDWSGLVLDSLIITAMTVLTAIRVADIAVFVAVIGPIVGARLAALRFTRHGGGPPSSGAGGGAVVSLALALATVFRRPAGFA